MDIKGEITGVRESGNKKILTLKNSAGVFKIIGKFESEFKKGITVSFINLEKKKSLLKTVFEATEKTLVFEEPEIFVSEREMKLTKFCDLAPLLASLFELKEKEDNKEVAFYRGIRGEQIDNKFSKIASRYSKELKGKFSYKQFFYDKKTGFLFYNVLHFGKFPVVFSQNEEKGKMLALSTENFKYVVINSDTGTMQEKEVGIKEAIGIASRRNGFVKKLLPVKNRSHLFEQDIENKCSPDCPVYGYCREIDNKKDKLETFEKYTIPFLKKELKFRKLYLKTLTSGINPLSGTTPVRLKSKDVLENTRIYSMRILSNEAYVKSKQKCIVTEKPPLDRKTLVFVRNVAFENMEVTTNSEILTPELISPLPTKKPILKGLFNFVYSDNSALPYLTGRNSSIDIYEPKKFIDNDETQNEAVNKIINMHGLFSLSGEHGTGKKYVLNMAISELIKYGKTFLIITQRDNKKEIEFTLKSELDNFIGHNNSIKIYSFNESEIFTEDSSFDYTVILLNETTDKIFLQSLAGKSRNIIFVTPPDFIPFEEKIPEANRVKLNKEHRFGSHILHFLQPVLSDKPESSPDLEIKIPEIEKADPKFKQIIDPSKFVLYITVKGEETGINNKWNEAEGEFAVLTVKEFAKSGVTHSRMEIIVPYERQKAYIKHLLKKEGNGNDIEVALPSESVEKDIVIISLTDTKRIGGEFANNSLLKIALTRARNKLIIAGNRGIHKTSKLLSRIL